MDDDPTVSAIKQQIALLEPAIAGATGFKQKELKANLQIKKDELKNAIKTAEISAAASKYSSDNSLKGTKYSSDNSLEGTKYSSDNSKQSSMYGSDMDYKGTVYSSDNSKQASMYGADKSLEGTKYASDNSKTASMYGADKSLEGSKFGSMADLYKSKYGTDADLYKFNASQPLERSDRALSFLDKYTALSQTPSNFLQASNYARLGQQTEGMPAMMYDLLGQVNPYASQAGNIGFTTRDPNQIPGNAAHAIFGDDPLGLVDQRAAQPGPPVMLTPTGNETMDSFDSIAQSSPYNPNSAVYSGANAQDMSYNPWANQEALKRYNNATYGTNGPEGISSYRGVSGDYNLGKASPTYGTGQMATQHLPAGVDPNTPGLAGWIQSVQSNPQFQANLQQQAAGGDATAAGWLQFFASGGAHGPQGAQGGPLSAGNTGINGGAMDAAGLDWRTGQPKIATDPRAEGGVLQAGNTGFVPPQMDPDPAYQQYLAQSAGGQGEMSRVAMGGPAMGSRNTGFNGLALEQAGLDPLTGQPMAQPQGKYPEVSQPDPLYDPRKDQGQYGGVMLNQPQYGGWDRSQYGQQPQTSQPDVASSYGVAGATANQTKEQGTAISALQTPQYGGWGGGQTNQVPNAVSNLLPGEPGPTTPGQVIPRPPQQQGPRVLNGGRIVPTQDSSEDAFRAGIRGSIARGAQQWGNQALEKMTETERQMMVSGFKDAGVAPGDMFESYARSRIGNEGPGAAA